jgi:hypothetical protein
LIALPLQHKPRERDNSVFLDDAFEPHSDQWAYLSLSTITFLQNFDKRSANNSR